MDCNSINRRSNKNILFSILVEGDVSSGVEVFVTTHMRSTVHYSGETSDNKSGLPWDTYAFCGAAAADQHSAKSATIHCAETLHGRWVLLRRQRAPLHICLLAIYVRKCKLISSLLHCILLNKDSF